MGMIPAEAVRDPRKPVCIVHHVRVKPGCADAYRDYALTHYIRPANTEPGCDPVVGVPGEPRVAAAVQVDDRPAGRIADVVCAQRETTSVACIPSAR